MTDHRHRALIVEDDDEIVGRIEDYLDSLGHTHDRAASQVEAHRLLDEKKYCYVLLDLEIPVKPKRIPQVECGINLLEEIRGRKESCSTQVIVMTSHGKGEPDLIVEVMKKGPADYLCKPFASAPDRRAPSRVIQEVLRKACKRLPERCSVLRGEPGDACVHDAMPVEAEPQPFTGGTLVFHAESVELLGQTVLTAKASRYSRPLLELLAKRQPDGTFAHYDGKALAEKIDRRKGQNDIAGYVKYLRDQITEALKQIGIDCKRQDVIESGGKGYRLNARVTTEYRNV